MPQRNNTIVENSGASPLNSDLYIHRTCHQIRTVGVLSLAHVVLMHTLCNMSVSANLVSLPLIPECLPWVFVYLSSSVGLSSLYYFTQSRGQDNNAKYLKATFGVQEDKNSGSQAQTNITFSSILVSGLLLQTDIQDQPPSAWIKLCSQIDHTAQKQCLLHSLSWWCFLALQWWLRMSCIHPRKRLRSLLIPIKGQIEPQFMHLLHNNLQNIMHV